MHQRMILFVLYRLFHKFHAYVAFPAIYTHFLPNQKYHKYRVIIVSKPKISWNIVWTQKKDIAQGCTRRPVPNKRYHYLDTSHSTIGCWEDQIRSTFFSADLGNQQMSHLTLSFTHWVSQLTWSLINSRDANAMLLSQIQYLSKSTKMLWSSLWRKPTTLMTRGPEEY